MSFDINKFENQINVFYKKMKKYKAISNISTIKEEWTLKDMVGHLIDSASNNHQRFIRLQLKEKLIFPRYDTEKWKSASNLKDMDYMFLVEFWKYYNMFLLHIIKNIDVNKLNNYWKFNKSQKSLEFLVNDYFVHMQWHEDLFDDTVKEIKKEQKAKK